MTVNLGSNRELNRFDEHSLDYTTYLTDIMEEQTDFGSETTK